MTSLRRKPAALMLSVAVTCVASVGAQEAPLVLEVRGGVAAPLGSFSNGARVGEGAAPGPSFGVDFVLPGAGRRSFYVGFSQHRFGCADAGCPSDEPYVATGFHAGYRIALLMNRSIFPWIRVAVVTTRVETDGLGGSNTGVSELGFGGELGVGVYIGSASPVAINPGVRLAAVNTMLPGGELLRMRYLVADVAIALAF